jgi:hypothetical protein
MHDVNEKLSKETEILKKNQTEKKMNEKIDNSKYWMESFSNGRDQVEERMSGILYKIDESSN